MGARPVAGGMSATHTHMTNSLNTPAEALEYAYPLRVREYRIRKGSGGKGKHKGGDGTIREIETLATARMALLSDRRKRAPYGLQGGKDGERGRAFIIRRDGTREQLTSKDSCQLEPGDRVRIETPSGGGWGKR
jgi:N-methylhydantoinase B